ncbi:NAD-glutamate dehydrogenase [Alphaproteobacteria bacterium]|nr:NAD-glutamate dehydrogenase [Alphaproteobacteria bacterium]
MQNLIKQIVNYSQKTQLPKGLEPKSLVLFLENFYGDNKLSDFENYRIEDLFNVAFFSYNFLCEAKKTVSKVRIYNPKDLDSNAKNEFTIIDIVNNDMPFLVDSVVAFVDKNGFKIKNVIHPVYNVKRGSDGKFLGLNFDKSSSDQIGCESIIQLHINKIDSKNVQHEIQNQILRILDSVKLVVDDFKPMLDLAMQAQHQLDNSIKIVKDQKYITEIKDFLQWLIDGNFIFLGANEFTIHKDQKDQYKLAEVSSSALGMFRTPIEEFKPQVVNSSSAEVNESITKPYVIEILKSRYRSKIHRIANAERIRVQKISATGEIIGEYRFIGLFTSSAYVSSISSIPLIRNKVQKVIEDSQFAKGSHNYKDLLTTLESYPRDELFQINEDDLLRNATGIVSICGRSVVKFFAREDKFKRFVSCLIFTPRDRSNSNVRDQIKELLSQYYKGEIADSFVQITDSNLIRFHVIIRTNGYIPEVDERKIELEIERMTKIFSDELLDAIKIKFNDINDVQKSLDLFARYKNAFSISYTNRFDAIEASCDIALIEKALSDNQVVFDLSSPEFEGIEKPSDEMKDICELKIFSPHQQIALSKIMPLLESFGFNVIQEHTYVINIEEDKRNRSITKVWIQYFQINLSDKNEKLTENIKNNFEEVATLIWQKIISSSPLNRLVINCELDFKQVMMLQAYTKYLYQTGFRYSANQFVDALGALPVITKNLVELFNAKFALTNQQSSSNSVIDKITKKIEDDLTSVKEVTYDQIVRKLLNVISATLRTNYFQVNEQGKFKGYLSFKFASQKITHLPLPKPHAEIFVFSNDVEAIHLRGGKVARGGLRWSDRHDDFRTEVLGLMKAQMTKNAVIVPVGSKGGFVIKSDLSNLNRDQIQQQAIECYKIFLSGLLDITDNVVNGKIIHPQNVIIHDQPDPYLVVAADKGTATFSDIANGISAKYNFWLGDAFASGGSVGYDHKKMGITAKGGWISVMRHFREMNIDTQNQDFTCVGIGDLSGDVFGNAMLLSQHIKLVGAFNHLHIFLDPNPDVKNSFLERQRMFNLPRSTWMDYNQSLISQGGGIFERSAKSIKISSQMQEILKITDQELAPNDLIKALLKAQVDLLWNGGIGTYVKASDESHQEVGDRANDSLRINGNELRCLVVGEGGNLGFTQKGRIEYALNGGRINTDAMDNSAGVDCSDHEVNIKIALTSAMRSAKLDMVQRNKDLEAMTSEVAQLVLKDNKEQTQAISIAQNQGLSLISEQAQFLDKIEQSGLLNRQIEYLPSRKEIEKRQREGISLTRPELCVMLAYSKMEIYNELLVCELVNDKFFEKDLLSYFPQLMQQKFKDEILNHQLRKEIIATQITNFIVNKIGISFVSQIAQDSGFAIVDVIRSTIIACEAFDIIDFLNEIEKLDGKIDFKIQVKMFTNANKLIDRSVLWLLRNQVQGDISSKINDYKKVIDELSLILPEVLAQDSKQSFERKIAEYSQEKIDKNLVIALARMDAIASAFDIFEIAKNSQLEIKIIAKIYFAVGTRFSLKWLRSSINKLELHSHWQKLSAKTMLEDFYFYQTKIAKDIINQDQKIKINEVEQLINLWINKYQFLVNRFDNFITELKDDPNHDLAMFSVALNRLKPLIN